MRHVLLALGERLSTEEVDELLKGAEDSEGLVSYEGKFLYQKKKIIILIFCHFKKILDIFSKVFTSFSKIVIRLKKIF